MNLTSALSGITLLIGLLVTHASLSAREMTKEHLNVASIFKARIFKDCEQCPSMIVIPSGEYVMGSPPSEAGHIAKEGPRHKVSIKRPFAVGRF